LVSTPYWPLNTALYSIDLHSNDPEYLRYLLEFLSPLFHVHAGKSAVPGVDRNDIHTIPVALPGQEQQRRIAALIGCETRRIDGLLAAKQRGLDLLAEKRKAIIAMAVTRGLDPKVKLRDSGVPWLGEIPAHWEIERARWLFRERDVRGEPDLPLMEVSIANGVSVREFSDERIETTAADFNSYKVARKNDIAFNKMRMWQGAVGVSPTDGLVSPDYVVAEPTGAMLPDYSGLLLRIEALSAECGRRSHGLTWDRLRIYWEEFREIKLPVPPATEQQAIVEHIARETAKLDAVRAATERTITLLKERRAALIAAAVTGQLDVGAVA
jgi:type I restriction enzyme S subunit